MWLISVKNTGRKKNRSWGELEGAWDHSYAVFLELDPLRSSLASLVNVAVLNEQHQGGAGCFIIFQLRLVSRVLSDSSFFPVVEQRSIALLASQPTLAS